MKIELVSVLIASIFFSKCRLENKDEITVAVASNMQFAMKEIVKEFARQTGVKCGIVTGSSGKLFAQIKEGAPFDVFISADMKYPERLYKEGYSKGKPEICSKGKLVIWTMFSNVDLSFDSLSKLDYVAIANPKTAPYGKASLEALKYLGLYKKIKNNLVYGESIAQVNQFIISKSSQVGITAKSIVLSSKLEDKGFWREVDEKAYNAIEQGIILLHRNGSNSNKAEQFYKFMFSKRAASLLGEYGYEVNLKMK